MATGIIEYEHEEILLEGQTHRLATERRHAVPGCAWGCDGGYHEIIFSEYGPLDMIPEPEVVVYPHGLMVFACECNSTILRAGAAR